MSGSKALAAEAMETRTTMAMIVCEVQLVKEMTCCNWTCGVHGVRCTPAPAEWWENPTGQVRRQMVPSLMCKKCG